jgi:hypothetical protein
MPMGWFFNHLLTSNRPKIGQNPVFDLFGRDPLTLRQWLTGRLQTHFRMVQWFFYLLFFSDFFQRSFLRTYSIFKIAKIGTHWDPAWYLYIASYRKSENFGIFFFQNLIFLTKNGQKSAAARDECQKKCKILCLHPFFKFWQKFAKNG